MLRTFIDELRTGKREGSVVSTQTTGSLSADEKEAWRQLRKELESVGITPVAFTQNRAFIVATLQKAIIEEGLAGDIPCTYDSLDFLDSGQEAFEALSTPGVIPSAEPNVKHTDEPLQQLIQQPIQDRISSNKVPNIDSPRRSKNVGRMARLLFKITNSKTAIVEAAKRGDAILVERLLDKGAAVDSKDQYGGTALWEAARNGHEAVVKLLLDKGAAVDSKDEFGQTPLVWAAANGHEAVVKLLQSRGALSL
jgi:Ankyrin repeats (3 copies)